jgi:hypothetical protein
MDFDKLDFEATEKQVILRWNWILIDTGTVLQDTSKGRTEITF